MDFQISRHSPLSGLPDHGPAIISLYTVGKHGRGYEEEVPAFLQAAKEAGLDSRVVLYEAEGRPEWRQSTLLKAELLYSLLSQGNSGQILLWLDIDARVRSNPFILPELYDLAVRRRVINHKQAEICTGTLFLRCCPATLSTVGHWRQYCTQLLANAHYLHWHSDQTGMNEVLDHAEETGTRILYLPPQFTWIDTLDRYRHGAEYEASCVIYHTQASRRRSR